MSIDTARFTRIAAFALIGLAVLLGIFALSLSRRPPVVVAPVARNAASFVVVVAARDLPVGKPIDANALALRMSPTRAPDEFGDAASLVGRVPLEPIAANASLTQSALATGLADAVAPGERAIAVRVDESNAVGNHVRPGNFVDVFFMLKRDGQGGPGADAEVANTQARLLLSRVKVLSFGDRSLPGAADIADPAGSGSNNVAPREIGGRTAVLSVRTADVDALTLAEGAGRIVLALRNPADREVAEPMGIAPLLVSIRNANDGAARAAAGMSLQALAGVKGDTTRTATATTVASLPPLPKVTASPRTRAVRVQSDELEVIRGARSEKVAY
jgi:pilus assembly protein CpaB